MTQTLVRGKYLVADPGHLPGTGLLTDGAVLVEAGHVSAIGEYRVLAASHPNARTLGSPRHMVIPGLVNAHHHGRGLSAAQLGVPDDHLERWLLDYLAAPALDVELDTLYANLRLIRSGVTTVIHSGYARVPGRLEQESHATLAAYRACGLRVAYAVGYEDQFGLVHGQDEAFFQTLPGPLARRARAAFAPPTHDQIERALNFVTELAAAHAQDDRVRILYGPSWTAWCSDALLARTAELSAASGLGIHIHALESPYERELARRRQGDTTIDGLERLGLLSARTTLAHGVWLTEDEIILCAQTGTSIAHCPSSNLRLRNGIAPVRRFWQGGLNVAIGTDSWGLNSDEDMFQEMRLAWMLARLPHAHRFVDGPSAHDILRMATLGGAEASTFGREFGTLLPGAPADLVILDYAAMTAPHIAPNVDPVDALLHLARPAHVDSVMIAGELVLDHGRFPGIDEDGVARRLAEVAARPRHSAESELTRLVRELRPHIDAHYAEWPDTTGEPFAMVNSRA